MNKDSKLPESQRTALAKSYADKALDSLRQAIKSGYADAAHIKDDKDLDPLRQRDDFKALIAELEQKAKTKTK